MGYPRRFYAPPGAPGTYHCTSRCVRRAFLCGEDALTGRSFVHRKQWIEDRIIELAEVFAVAVHAYAVMSNHVHVVVELAPAQARSWTDEEVAKRWLTLFGKRAERQEPLATRIDALAVDARRIAVLRERLADLSWFMRCLNEPIARRANKEDGCTGRFWEGRYKSQKVLDDSSLLAGMVYVDLNPVRAGLADAPEQGRHTSLRRRCVAEHLTSPLSPIAGSIEATAPLPLSTAQYLELVDWTGRALHGAGKRGIPANAPSILTRLGFHQERWLSQVPALEEGYWRAVGTEASLRERARQCGLRWIKGVRFARRLERLH